MAPSTPMRKRVRNPSARALGATYGSCATTAATGPSGSVGRYSQAAQRSPPDSNVTSSRCTDSSPLVGFGRLEGGSGWRGDHNLGRHPVAGEQPAVDHRDEDRREGAAGGEQPQG